MEKTCTTTVSAFRSFRVSACAQYEFCQNKAIRKHHFTHPALPPPLLLFTNPTPYALTPKPFPQMKSDGANPSANQKPHSHTPNAVCHPSSALPPAFVHPVPCRLRPLMHSANSRETGVKNPKRLDVQAALRRYNAELVCFLL
jgi:hypothetical protein